MLPAPRTCKHGLHLQPAVMHQCSAHWQHHVTASISDQPLDNPDNSLCSALHFLEVTDLRSLPTCTASCYNKSREGRTEPGESKARLQFLIREDRRRNQKMRHSRVHYSATASSIFCLHVCLCTTPMFPREPVFSHRQRYYAQFPRQSSSCPCWVVSATPPLPYNNHSSDS